MKCPEDGTTISTKHFDAEWGMYECPKCGSLYTADEIEEASNGTSPRKRAQAVTRIGPVAKGKKRRTEIAEDEDRLDKDVERILGDVRTQESRAKHRDEIPTSQVVEVWAGEIQDVYEELGGRLDEANAKDKALTLWREIQTQTNVTLRHRNIEFALCQKHS